MNNSKKQLIMEAVSNFKKKREQKIQPDSDSEPIIASASSFDDLFIIILDTQDITDSTIIEVNNEHHICLFYIKKDGLYKHITQIQIKTLENEPLYNCNFSSNRIFWKQDVTQITLTFNFNTNDLKKSVLDVVLVSSNTGTMSNDIWSRRHYTQSNNNNYRWQPERTIRSEQYIPSITDKFIVDTVVGNNLTFIIDPVTYSNNIDNKVYSKFGFGGKSRKRKSKNQFTKKLLKYSNPRKAQSMAYKYLGKSAKLYPARNSAKKYSIFDQKNKKWVNFGQIGYEDYTKHKDKKRRKSYLTRSRGMLGNWKKNKYSANNLSMHILW